jgi:hypothetical protein
MNMPSFTAEGSLLKSGYGGDLASHINTAWLKYVMPTLEAAQGITPAIPMDDRILQRKICLKECRAEGGINCEEQCRVAEAPDPIGHGTSPGTSDAQALCCMGIFAACMGGAWGSPLGMLGCMVKATSCTQEFPCNAL